MERNSEFETDVERWLAERPSTLCANTGVDANKDLRAALAATSAAFRREKRADAKQPLSAPASAGSSPVAKRTTEGVPPPVVDRVAELLIQRNALMAVAMRVGQGHEATRALLDHVFEIDQELGAATLSSREGAIAALKYVQDQYIGDRQNEHLGIGDAAVLHLLAGIGDYVRSGGSKDAN